LRIGVVVLVGCSVPAGGGPSGDGELLEAARGLFGVVEPAPPGALGAPEVTLGRRLFWDERISGDGETSCATCHTIAGWGADQRRFSEDARGRLTGRHSQTVFNAMEQPALRWLGDRRDGAEQAERSITGSMGLEDGAAIATLLASLGYVEAFSSAFPDDTDPVSAANYARALQAYQSTLRTPAPFDSFLGGDVAALTDQQKAGLRNFMSIGCATCHAGKLLGGISFRRFGIAQDYWTVTGSEEIDTGLHSATNRDDDRYVFRVSMLRNIARTAPYFHDGSVATLPEAVRAMATLQLGRSLPDAVVNDIVAFLESLTGDIPANFSRPVD